MVNKYIPWMLCLLVVYFISHSYAKSNSHLLQTHRGSPFPTVAEAIQEDLDEYRTKEGEVSKLKNAMVSICCDKLPITMTLCNDICSLST